MTVSNTAPFTPIVGGLTLTTLSLTLFDSTPYVVLPNVLPGSFGLGDFSSSSLFFGFTEVIPCDDEEDLCTVPGFLVNLSSLQTGAAASAVPEPVTLALLGGGVAALVARRRRTAA